MNVLIGADYMPGILDGFNISHIETIISEEIKNKFEDNDFRILNLETPITSYSKPINKCGKSQRTCNNSIDILQYLRIDLLALANNHIMDYGEVGLRDTILELDKRSIAHVGAGKDIIEASNPYVVITKDNKKMGIYNCCEHEFNIVTPNSPGANPYDPLTSFEHIEDLRKKCDYIIVLYHGGKEYYPYPTPNLQKACHKMIDKGADLVIVQHTHCIGCDELYHDGTIVYGQGNFYSTGTDQRVRPESLLIRVDTNSRRIEYIPIRKDKNTIELAHKNDAYSILNSFNKRSEDIKIEGFIESSYKDYTMSQMINYGKYFAVKGSLIDKALNKISRGKYSERKVKSYFTLKRSLEIENMINCETHRECIVSIMKQLNSMGKEDK